MFDSVDFTFQEFIRFWARLSLLLILVEAYLTVNKIWIRKHEPMVADSVSVSAQLLAVATGIPFVALYINEGAYEGAIGDGIILLVNMALIAIGIGLWVEGRRGMGFWANLKKSLRTERSEAGALFGEILHPASARQLLQIMLDMALIDDEFDERERAFISDIARQWNVDFEQLLREHKPEKERSYSQLRGSVEAYLASSPPTEQAGQLRDVLVMLVSIDDIVSEEEQMMMDELGGMLDTYITGTGEAGYYVFIAPQSPRQETALQELMPDFKKESRLGGEVLIVGRYHSRAYADLVRDRYRDAGYLTVAEEAARQPTSVQDQLRHE